MGALAAGSSASSSTCRRCSTCVVCLPGGMVAGAAWGGVSGALKSCTGAHEVITTIMLNYIAGAPARLGA